MNAGVREYWILDPDQQKLLLYFFENENCPMICGLDAPIPVGIYNGELKLDFTHIKKWIEDEDEDEETVLTASKKKKKPSRKGRKGCIKNNGMLY